MRVFQHCSLRAFIVAPWRLRAALLVILSACAANGYCYNPDEFLDDYCSRCHNDERMSGNWSLSMVDSSAIDRGEQLGEWEAMLRVTERGEMPPPNRPQPSDSEREQFLSWLQASLDGYADANPNPGRATLRRLNRSEYSNAVRDLLAIDVDIREALPTDDSGYGFDNIADVLSVSPTLMDRYIAVAGKISRLALGVGSAEPYNTTFMLPKDGSILNQGVPSYDWRMSADLPLDSRGGGAFDYYAPYGGEYEISAYLNSNTNNEVDRLEENRVAMRLHLSAGAHTIGMAFRKRLALDESVQTLRNSTDIVPLPTAPPEPLILDFIVDGARVGNTTVPSYYMSSRYAQHNFPRDVLQIDVEGPYQAGGAGNTASRAKIFACKPWFWPITETYCARKNIAALARQAYRGQLDDADIDRLMQVYQHTATVAGYEQGIAAAVQAVLVAPKFLFLYEQSPADAFAGEVHKLNDYEFAARLALFLWSSLPDAELLDLAAKGSLRQPQVLDKQVRRMLADDRAIALQQNFAGQWLYLRNLEFHRPDVVAFPEFDVPLRQAMQQESELFFGAVLRNNASILDFIKSDYTYLNERLAEHYGIDGVDGPMFRRVSIADEPLRGGLLGQASILTVTSYGNHTSVVRRGKWILDNLLAAPPPPPPPDIPGLKTQNAGKALNAREQLALHSEDPACASCHVKMDPLGLALEKYDAVGKFRRFDAGRPIDVSAIMPNGREFEGLAGLQAVLLDRKAQFAGAFTERLMIYALGRGLEPYDQPKVRAIVRAAEPDDYRIGSIIKGIINSEPFNYRRTPDYEESALTQSSSDVTRARRCSSAALHGVDASVCAKLTGS